MKVFGAVKQAAAAAVAAVATVVAPARPGSTPGKRDPFLADDERRAQINADGAARRGQRARAIDAELGGGSWLGGRRNGWLR